MRYVEANLIQKIMIDLLVGTVQVQRENAIALLTSGGVRFEVHVPHPQHFAINTQVSITIYFHWSAEQGPSIFGFSSEAERTLFINLIDCNGIGPKLALSILSQMEPAEFVRAIEQQDLDALSSLQGIGKKKAEQIVVSLKHKITRLIEAGVSSIEGLDTRQLAQVLSSLNYSKTEIQTAVQAVQQRFIGATSAQFDEQMRVALAHLAKYKQISK